MEGDEVPGFDLTRLADSDRASGTWAASLLHALARDEAAGRRAQRLTEPKLATWNRFKGRLTAPDFFALLFEDAAVLHRIPFEANAVDPSLRVERVPESVATDWLGELQSIDLATPGADYITDQARMLGLPTRMARSDLHLVKSHQKVLELPGTGGQLAHHLASSQSDLTLQDNFTVACGSWQELTLAGIVALDLAAPNSGFAIRTEIGELKDPDHPVRQKSYDYVVGLHPDKGGLFQADEQLSIWFPNAKILLV